MFARLHQNGGTAYVLGGLGVLAMIPAPIAFLALWVMKQFGMASSFPDIIIYASLGLFIIGGLITTVVFSPEMMQVNEQRNTNALLEELVAQKEREVSQKKRQTAQQA